MRPLLLLSAVLLSLVLAAFAFAFASRGSSLVEQNRLWALARGSLPKMFMMLALGLSMLQFGLSKHYGAWSRELLLPVGRNGLWRTKVVAGLFVFSVFMISAWAPLCLMIPAIPKLWQAQSFLALFLSSLSIYFAGALSPGSYARAQARGIPKGIGLFVLMLAAPLVFLTVPNMQIVLATSVGFCLLNFEIARHHVLHEGH